MKVGCIRLRYSSSTLQEEVIAQHFCFSQFQDNAATKLVRKKGFEVLFLIHAALPMLFSSIVITIYSFHMDPMLGFEIMAHFSPLTYWDVFIVYTFQASSFIMPLILHKSYKRMEKGLTEFSQLYAQSMHGVIGKGGKQLLSVNYFPIQIYLCYVNLGEIDKVFDDVTTKQVVSHGLAFVMSCSMSWFFIWLLWYLVPVGNLSLTITL